MFYGGMGYLPTTNQTSFNSTYDYQDDGPSTLPVQSEDEEKHGDAKLESIYSCDSILDESEYPDCDDDDSEPFDRRIKQYMAAHGKEMKLPMANPMQQYAELKIAKVLSRGTLSEKTTKRRLEKLEKSLPPHKVITSDYQEALDLLKELNSYIDKHQNSLTRQQNFMRKKRFIAKLKEEKVWRVKRNKKGSYVKNKGRRILDVRKFLRDLVSSSSEDERELNDYESSGDESIDFSEFHKLKLFLPGKRDKGFLDASTNENLTKGSSKKSNSIPVHHHEASSPKAKRPSFQVTSSSRKYFKDRRCSRAVDLEDLKIAKKKLIILYKQLILDKLQHNMFRMKNDKGLMKHNIFRIWSDRQVDGLEKMESDIIRRKTRLNFRIKRVQNNKKLNQMSQVKNVDKKKNKPIFVPEIQDAKHRRWTRTAECMHQREKLLTEKQGGSFMAGFLGDRAKIRTKRLLKKDFPKMPSNIGVPPGPPGTNKKILKVMAKFMESKLPAMTFGDLLRIVAGDISFTVDEDSVENDLCDTSESRQEGVGVADPSKGQNCKEWDDFIKKDNGSDTSLLTKQELKKYFEMVNEKFISKPDFKLAEELVSIDKNSLVFQEPRLLKMNYSLKELEKRIHRARNVKCAQSRAIYFFQYRSEFTPIDIQAAYEQYITGNIGLGQKSHDHPKGCLMIYSNVKLVIVMIEGAVDHLFYHFAGFKNSRLIKFIEIGRVLYVYERVQRILNEWVSIVISTPPGEITYFTKSKKVLHRVAEPRAHSFKAKLHNLYTFLSKKFQVNSKSQDRGDGAMPSNMKCQLDPCQCHHTESNERGNLTSKFADITGNQKVFDNSKGEYDSSLHELLPSPALVGYLLKYKKLKTIDRFLDEFIMQPAMENEDEKYNVVEDAVLSNFVDSDDEKNKRRLIKEIKQGCKERGVIMQCKHDLMDALEQTENRAPWAQYYDTTMFTPKLTKVQVRKTGDAHGREIEVDPLIDSDDASPDKIEEQKQYIEWSHENEKIAARRRFLNFIDTGAESWQKKVKRFGLTGQEVKEMLEDARKYKDLRRTLRLQDKMKMAQQEVPGEEVEMEPVIEQQEQGDGDKSESLLREAEEQIEELVTELEGEAYEVLGEGMDWPHLMRFERLGEFPERFGEERYHRDFPLMEWDGELDGIGLESPRTEQLYEKELSEIGETFTENTSAAAEDVETIPEAPPATSVTDTSTDP